MSRTSHGSAAPCTPSRRSSTAVFLASSDRDYVPDSTCFMDGGLMQKVGPGA